MKFENKFSNNDKIKRILSSNQKIIRESMSIDLKRPSENLCFNRDDIVEFTRGIFKSEPPRPDLIRNSVVTKLYAFKKIGRAHV